MVKAGDGLECGHHLLIKQRTRSVSDAWAQGPYDMIEPRDTGHAQHLQRHLFLEFGHKREEAVVFGHLIRRPTLHAICVTANHRTQSAHKALRGERDTDSFTPPLNRRRHALHRAVCVRSAAPFSAQHHALGSVDRKTDALALRHKTVHSGERSGRLTDNCEVVQHFTPRPEEEEAAAAAGAAPALCALRYTCSIDIANNSEDRGSP